jgi:hypothetical protein
VLHTLVLSSSRLLNSIAARLGEALHLQEIFEGIHVSICDPATQLALN